MELRPGYKQTEVGVIPEDWTVKTLGELGQFKNGINKGKEDFGHGFPFVNLMDVFGIPRVSTAANFGLVNSSVVERKLYELRGGDVLFVRSSVKPEGVGLTTLIPEDLPDTVFSGFLIRYRDNDQLAHEFKEHCFWQAGFRSRLVANSTVSANTNINQDALKALQIAFPSEKEEQRAIAETLRDVDALLGALTRLIAKKRDLKQAAMQQLLTGQQHLPGFSGEWEVKRFGDLFQFLNTANNPRANLSEFGDVGYIHYGDIHTSVAVFLDCVSEVLPLIAKTKVANIPLLQDGDLVMVDASEDYEGIGKCVEIRNATGRRIVAGLHTFLLRGNRNLLADGFKGYLQFIPSVKAALVRFATGISVYGISKNNVRSIEVLLPSIEEQTATAAVLSDMDAEIAALEARLAKTRALKQGMMQELLTGKTRLV